MKRWIHNSTSIQGGVRFKDDLFFIDYRYNAPEDIIDIVEPQLYVDIHNNKCYTFGYRFNDNASSKQRTQFIQSLKQIGNTPLNDSQLEQFIERPLTYIEDLVNLYKIECLVYPRSQRSPLVSKMIKCINNMTSHNMEGATFELVKSAPVDIEFDFKSFERDFGDSQGYKQMLKYIDSTLMPKIATLDYFSLAHNVKSKYRPYIKGFFKFDNEEDFEKFSKLQGSNILIIDDINTTGSTLNEILRKLGEINNNCNFYIYTLIGK